MLGSGFRGRSSGRRCSADRAGELHAGELVVTLLGAVGDDPGRECVAVQSVHEKLHFLRVLRTPETR